MAHKIVIDATNAVLGRLASYAAKQALLGHEIIIVNCDKAIVTGKHSTIIREYHISRSRGGSSLNGPHFPKTPERILKRTIRGMLSYKQGRGLAAFKRIICYNLVPTEYESTKKIHAGKEKKTTTTTLKHIGEEI